MSHYYHSSRWPDLGKVFAVNPAHGFPVLGAGQVDAGAHYVFETGAGLGKRRGGNLEDAPCLLLRILVFSAHRRRARQTNLIPHAHCAREADDTFVGRVV